MNSKLIIAIGGLVSTALWSQASIITLTNPDNADQGEVRAAANVPGVYDSTGSSTLAGNLRVGEYNQTPDKLARDVVKFTYSTDTLAGETLANATLRLYVTSNHLTASGPGSSVFLYYSQADNANTGNSASDFEDTSFALIGTMAGLTNGAATGAWYEFDVTASVLDDLANDGTGISAGSSFRIQLNDDLSLTAENALNYMNFTDYSDASGVNAPELVLETIPEPATLGLISAFGGGILFIRRRFII